LEQNLDLCDIFQPGSHERRAYDQRLEEVAGLAELFKVLSDQTRINILYLLAHEPLCTCDLADILGLTLPAISHHLRLLRTMNLVKGRREGKMVYYSLADDHVLALIDQAQEHYNEGR
jgi:DNA-binding transcriptional ArsR family regulator